MVLIDFITRKKRLTQIISVNSVGDTNTFQIDVTKSINHNMSSTITSNPIEDGSNITDHVNLDNRKISIDCFISNSPLDITQSLVNTVATSVPNQFTIPVILGSVISSFQNSSSKIQDAFLILEELWTNRIPFKVQTGLKLYEDMVINSISIPVTNQNALNFKIELQQIEIANSEVVLVPETSLADDVKHTASSKQSEGKKNISEVSDDIQTKGSSVLFKIQGTGN